MVFLPSPAHFRFGTKLVSEGPPETHSPVWESVRYRVRRPGVREPVLFVLSLQHLFAVLGVVYNSKSYLLTGHPF